MLLLVLLALSVAINYIDRGALSVSAPLLASELALNPASLGLLFSAFFWSYALFQLVAGWLVDRYDVKWVYAAGFGLWSLATALTGFAASLPALFAARLALGAGESVAYPACSRLIVRGFPEERRGLANALVDAASKLGPAFSTLFGGLAVSAYGWRPMFIALGLASLLWLIPWLAAVPSESRQSRAGDAAGGATALPFSALLRRREVWITSAGMFCLGYVWYFLISWLPTYLVKERGFSLQAMAVFGSLPFFVMAASSTLGGWWSDRAIRSGASPSRVRRTFAAGGLAGCGLCMLPAALAPDPTLAIALLSAACFSLGFYTSNVWAITQTLAGQRAAGKWTGIQNAIGNLGGVVSPWLTGWIVARQGSFFLAFIAAVAVLALGTLCYAVALGPVRPLDWDNTSSSSSSS